MLEFVPNGGQWESQVMYRASMSSGVVFLERDRFTFTFPNQEQLAALHDLYHYGSYEEWENTRIDNHAYQVIFRYSSHDVRMVPHHPRTHYYNYFIGNNPSKWATDLYPFSEVRYEDLYPGIDVVTYSSGRNFKYDFVVAPGAKPEVITLEYVGPDELRLEDGHLLITTSVNELKELRPVAYQVIGGKRVAVECRYLLRGNELSFYFPEGYNPKFELIIDPELVGSTYSGSSVAETVEGFVAGYDTLRNILSAGVCYQNGYPVTVGAYQTAAPTSYNGAVSKFNTDASILLWATFIGGDSARENIHGIVCNSSNDVVLFGSTLASGHPTTVGAYDGTFNGGQDLFLSTLSFGGNALLASTFIGGSDVDGRNDISFNSEDRLRGELQLDDQDNCYIISCTRSTDFPTTPGVIQTTHGGLQDAVMFKMDKNHSNLIWSTYIGGSGVDMGYSLRVDAAGNVFAVGATQSPDFPTTGGTANPAYLGNGDGFIAKVNSTATSLLKVSFVGTPTSIDQTHYLEFNSADEVFIYGQSSKGNMPVTAGTYSNPNSGMYVQKYDSDLSALLVATVFGSGRDSADLVPSGFNIDICDFIYAGGFEKRGSHAPIPTTHDAFQPKPHSNKLDSTNFYFIVFDRDLVDTLYATYIGGYGYDHTHGGTSRYDEFGSVYQGVCNYDGRFPTTPSAFAPTKPSPLSKSDMVVFKFDFEQSTLEADFTIWPSNEICAPVTARFTNTSKNAVFFEWDFGNGETSTEQHPSVRYNDTGTYVIRLIADNPAVCFQKDTHYLTIKLYPKPVADFTFNPPSPVSALTSIEFTDLSTDTYVWEWDFGDSTQSTTRSPRHIYPEDGTYEVCLAVTGALGCADTLCKTIIVDTKYDAVIPTAFTPNGDFLNDEYYVYGYGFRTFEFRIYNRWGQLVFETTDIDTGWDGTYNGEPQPIGVYAYYVRGVTFKNTEVSFKGNVTLLR